MNIGRPTEFDRQDALEKSMELFWKNGYEATSLAELIKTMGIGRQSLYNAFGDKHSLFIEATKHYIGTTGQHVIDTLKGADSPIGNIRKTLEQIADFISDGKCRGCLVTNSIVELAPHDDEVRKLVQSMVNRVEKTIQGVLDRAVEEGEIPTETNTQAVARFLNSTVHGLVVIGKISPNRAALKDIVKVAMTTLE